MNWINKLRKELIFPRSVGIDERNKKIVECFLEVEEQIKSSDNHLSSNEVLKILRPHLVKIGMNIESGKAKGKKIPVPVLFG